MISAAIKADTILYKALFVLFSINYPRPGVLTGAGERSPFSNYLSESVLISTGAAPILPPSMPRSRVLRSMPIPSVIPLEI